MTEGRALCSECGAVYAGAFEAQWCFDRCELDGIVVLEHEPRRVWSANGVVGFARDEDGYVLGAACAEDVPALAQRLRSKAQMKQYMRRYRGGVLLVLGKGFEEVSFEPGSS